MHDLSGSFFSSQRRRDPDGLRQASSIFQRHHHESALDAGPHGKRLWGRAGQWAVTGAVNANPGWKLTGFGEEESALAGDTIA